MSLDVTELGRSILEAFKGILKDSWATVKEYAKGEAKKLAQTLAQITKLYVTQQVSEAEASVLLEMHKNAARAVFLTIEGIGLITAQRAIDAGLAAVAQVVNGAIGFPLI